MLNIVNEVLIITALILIWYLANVATEMFNTQSMLILHHQSSKHLEILKIFFFLYQTITAFYTKCFFFTCKILKSHGMILVEEKYLYLNWF